MRTPIELTVPAQFEGFSEAGYLAVNWDVARAVKQGQFASGYQHFQIFGHREPHRRMRRLNCPELRAAKAQKQARMMSLINGELPHAITDNGYDFLTPELRQQCAIQDTDAVSGNLYDPLVMALVDNVADGLILDCGAGQRDIYYEQVVNFEIVDYDTTDVRGVGEQLPFVDNAFDGVLSLAVLEHVKDPFACAAELQRVLKPGGWLLCQMPFLQPRHGYPHHYYNATDQGLRNLFADLIIDRLEVVPDLHPIHSLTWILKSWSEGLPEEARQQFQNLKIGALLAPAAHYQQQPFVAQLAIEKQFELASGHMLWARKPVQPSLPPASKYRKLRKT